MKARNVFMSQWFEDWTAQWIKDDNTWVDDMSNTMIFSRKFGNKKKAEELSQKEEEETWK